MGQAANKSLYLTPKGLTSCRQPPVLLAVYEGIGGWSSEFSRYTSERTRQHMVDAIRLVCYHGFAPLHHIITS